MPKHVQIRDQFGDTDEPERKQVWKMANRVGVCPNCRFAIAVGDKILWDMEKHIAYCNSCGDDLYE